MAAITVPSTVEMDASAVDIDGSSSVQTLNARHWAAARALVPQCHSATKGDGEQLPTSRIRGKARASDRGRHASVWHAIGNVEVDEV
mmetsp:Transcript_36891/g.78702  ORF Transcript_36891/g.78702 Transcript_36891/m.78702 type:complete len:87 (-) Transcript_36891:116-376(-)